MVPERRRDDRLGGLAPHLNAQRVARQGVAARIDGISALSRVAIEVADIASRQEKFVERPVDTAVVENSMRPNDTARRSADC